MTLTGYLALLDAIYVKLPAKLLLKIQTVWVLSKVLASLVKNCFMKRPSGAPLHTLSKLYYYVPVGFVTPPPLLWRQCLLYLWSPKSGCCSISGYLSCFSNISTQIQSMLT